MFLLELCQELLSLGIAAQEVGRGLGERPLQVQAAHLAATVPGDLSVRAVLAANQANIIGGFLARREAIARITPNRVDIRTRRHALYSKPEPRISLHGPVLMDNTARFAAGIAAEFQPLCVLLNLSVCSISCDESKPNP